MIPADRLAEIRALAARAKESGVWSEYAQATVDHLATLCEEQQAAIDALKQQVAQLQERAFDLRGRYISMGPA